MSVRMMDIGSLINQQQQRRRSSLFMSITNTADDWQSNGEPIMMMRSISPELRHTPSLLLPRLTPTRRLSGLTGSALPSLGSQFANLVPPSPSTSSHHRPLTIRLRLPQQENGEVTVEAADGLHLLASLALRQQTPEAPPAPPAVVVKQGPALPIKKGKKSGHSCPDCGSIFPSRSRLRRHELMHTGARPWTCDWPGCGRSFGRKDNMMQHQRTHMAHQQKLRHANVEEGHSSLSD